MTDPPTIQVLPFGRCREHVSKALNELGPIGCTLVDPSARPALGPTVQEEPVSAPLLSLAVLDDRDEALLGDVERAAANAPAPFVVLYVRDAERTSQDRTRRLANRWRACVIEVESTQVAIAALRCLAEPLTVPGLVGFDFAAVAEALRAPSTGSCHTASFGPDHGAWTAPASWRPSLDGVDRGLLGIRCGAATTLFDINDVCAKIMNLAPQAAFVVSCHVVSDDSATITAIGLGAVEPTS